jgi:glycosyltransferase involved in cell wall biosynthesis
MNESAHPEFSFVVPIYNSASMLPVLLERIENTMRGMGRSFEIVFVNDGSRDNSWQVLKQLHDSHETVRIFNLTRNYGQQKALFAGLKQVRGEYIVTLDDDLQNPPEELPVLLAKLEEGYDAVFGAYHSKKHGWVQNLGSRFFRALSNYIFNNTRNIRFSSYRLVRRHVIDAVMGINTSFPYISGMMMSVTDSIANVYIRHDVRMCGKSAYNFRKLVALAVQLLISYSLLPLKALSWVGLAVSGVSFILAGVFIVHKLVTGNVPPGWTALVVLISVYNAMTMLALLIMGTYLGRILSEVSSIDQIRIKEKHE